MVTAHTSICNLTEELETEGYFFLRSRSMHGRLLALRYNLEEAPEIAVRIDLDPSMGQHCTTEAVKRTAQPRSSGAQTALQAVHDVLSWNHVFDPVHQRAYTALTRNWSQKKFGGFGIWLNDILFHALFWSLLDPAKSQQNIDAIFAHQTSDGNFPCLVTGNDAWLDRSQIPMASYVVWALYRVTGDLTALKDAYPKLLANHRWWWRRRSLADTGLVAYGTSAGPGDGLYKGTKLAAKNESSMDNMAVHDEAPFDQATGLIQAADVGLNALLALDGDVLSLMARRLGSEQEAKDLASACASHKARIRTWLWDERRSVFANRRPDGAFISALAPTSFFPMVAGIASAEQADALVTGYLQPADKFGGEFIIPSAPRDHPAFHDNSYWRGRVWGPLNYWVYQGLVRYGYLKDAETLADKSRRLFATHWADRKCGENYSAVTGDIEDQPDADLFYTWGALLPALSVMHIVSETPWDGLTLTLGAQNCSLGPIQCHLGLFEILPKASGWVVMIDGDARLSGIGSLCLKSISWTADIFSATVTTDLDGASLTFECRPIEHAHLNGQPIKVRDKRIQLPNNVSQAVLEVTLDAD